MISARDEARTECSETGEVILGYRRLTGHTASIAIADDALAFNGDRTARHIEIGRCRADRHNGVRRMMEGVSMPIIQRQLGHASLATTNTYPPHITPKLVIGTMGKRVWSAE